MNARPPLRAAAVVVAGGRGLRAGGTTPKQFSSYRGKPLVRHAVEAFEAAELSPIVVVVPGDFISVAEECLHGCAVDIVAGGETRQQSVRAGLEHLAKMPPELVLVHDAARPGLRQPVVDRVVDALADSCGAIPVLPVVDSLFRDGSGAVARDGLHRVQTPQGFRFPEILKAHRAWEGSPDAGDDAEVARSAGLEVALVEGDEALRKVTFARDLDGPSSFPRTGVGYDVHRLADGEELWLCGVRIDHSRGLAGHSDADVALHALTDAILGAACAGDIGEHFPPSDPKWRGASSDRFLAHAAKLARRVGLLVGHIDLTIVCEAPRIGPHKPAMRQRIAEILGLDISAVSVKATTTERLGFTGRSEGIAAQAIATLHPLSYGSE